MSEENLWKTASSELKKGKLVLLIAIVKTRGSVPRKAGAKLLITQAKTIEQESSSEQIVGTVGGGSAEYQLVERGRKYLKAKSKKRISEVVSMQHREVTHPNRSGMICSGSQTFVLISLNKSNLSSISKIIKQFHKKSYGILKLTSEGLFFDDSTKNLKARPSFVQISQREKSPATKLSSWSYQECCGILDTLYIIGGGHVSLALSKILYDLNFRVVIFDNREDLPTMEKNIYTNEKYVISYKDIRRHINPGPNSYVCIMTFGHQHDQFVLEKLLTSSLKLHYIGLMGSLAKKKEIFKNLSQKGISKNQLSKVYCPIGLAIGSTSPEEISISIAAELVKIRNK